MKRVRGLCCGIVGWALGMAPALALAAAEPLCSGDLSQPGPDGRRLGHIPYAEASPRALVAAPRGFGDGLPCLLQPEAAADLVRLLDAAKGVPGVGGRLHGISCYRSIAHQRAVFCSQIGPRRKCRDAAERARSVGPPGYSEHATGYALDFSVRPAPGCPDVQPCMADTPAGAWLLAHAPEFGFELSFPVGNAQGVTWEPWHWRWVGASAFVSGAGNARALFARARAEFPAYPAIDPVAADVAVPARPVLEMLPAVPVVKGKR